MRRARTHRLAVDGGELTVRSMPGDGPAVVLLPGLGTTQRVWNGLLRRLPPNRRVVTYDYRGHGASTAVAPPTLDALLDDLDDVVGLASDTGPVLLCGWSIGADLAVWYAAAHPARVAGVIALDGALPTPAPPRVEDPEPPRMVWGRFTDVVGRLVTRVHLDTGQLTELSRQVDVRRAGLDGAYSRLHGRVPVTVVVADRDLPGSAHPATEWRRAAARLAATHPGIDVMHVDSDHAFPLRSPGDVARLVECAVGEVPTAR